MYVGMDPQRTWDQVQNRTIFASKARFLQPPSGFAARSTLHWPEFLQEFLQKSKRGDSGSKERDEAERPAHDIMHAEHSQYIDDNSAAALIMKTTHEY